MYHKFIIVVWSAEQLYDEKDTVHEGFHNENRSLGQY